MELNVLKMCNGDPKLQYVFMRKRDSMFECDYIVEAECLNKDYNIDYRKLRVEAQRQHV